MGTVTTDTVRAGTDSQVLRLSRTLKALRNSSKAIAHADDETALLKAICRVIVEDCGHAMVWVGLAENDAGKSIRPAAYAGFEEGYLETLGLTWADTERGQGPTGRAIRTGELCLCRNMLTDPAFEPWRDEARRRGYAASVALPLAAAPGERIGAITLYSRHPDPFTADELKLLADLADDLSFGLRALTEHKRSQRERDLTIAFLRMVNLSKDSNELLRTAALFFKKHAGCDAVGIRLRSGDDFPYSHTIGFSDAFLAAERSLCTHCEAGQQASLACLCGHVITGGACPGGLAFTPHGSFCSNDSLSLLQRPFEAADLIRGRCIQEGYGSIALLPLHDGPRRLGLVQLNAWRKGAFQPEALSLWERLADHLAVAVAKTQTEEALRESEQRIQQALRVSHSFTFDWIPATDAVLRSESCSAILGLTGEAVCHDTGQHFFQSIHPDDRGRFIQILQSLTPAVSSYTTEYRFIRADGMVTVLEEIGQAAFSADGKLEHLVGVTTDITQRRRAEEALRVSEELNRQTLQALPAHIAVIDRNGRVEAVNEAWEHFARENNASDTSSVQVGANYLEVCRKAAAADSADAAQALDGIESVLAGARQQFTLEYPCHSPQEKRWFLMAVTPLGGRGENGAVLSHFNITARKQSEERLFETSQRLQALMTAVPVGISFSDDATCQRVGGNPAVLAQFEVTPKDNLSASAPAADAPGRKVQFFRDGRPIANSELPLQRAVAENSVIPPMELEVLLPSGRRWVAEASGAPVRDAQGHVIGGIAVTADITQRKRIEEVLRFLGQYDTRSGNGSFFHDLARFLAQSFAMDFACIDRLEDDHLSAQTLAVFHKGEFQDNVAYTLKETPCGAVVGKRICCFPQNVRHLFPADKVLQNLNASSYLGTTLWSAQGKPIGLIAVIGQQPLEDTRIAESVLQLVAVRAAAELERVQAEQALTRLNAELELRVQARTEELASTNRELEAFCYSVSHDLRAPLRSMDGFSQALLEDYGAQLDAAGQDFLNRIRANCQRLARLIDDLLRLSRLTRAQMRHQPVDLTGLAQAVVAELRQAEPDRTVDVRIAPGLTASGDPVLLRTALGNLLQNAWKFTGRRPDAVIEVGLCPPSSVLSPPPSALRPQPSALSLQPSSLSPPSPVFFVRDNGVGFDMQYADKLFTPFQRLHAMTEFPGSGIGLATVQRVIHRHNGRVWFESTAGQGATFYFTTGGGA